MSWQLALNIVGVAGSLLSALGVYFAIKQIRLTLKAAEAAKAASELTQRAISSNVLLTDASACTRIIEEIKSLLRSRKYELALLRVTDLNTLIIQVQSLSLATGDQPDQRPREALTNLSVLRDLLELKIDDAGALVETAKVNAELSRIADRLSHWIGRRSFSRRRSK